MPESKVGLYLGVNSVGVVVVQGKNITSLANGEFSSLEETDSTVLNDDIRWEALINKALREANAASKEVYVSVADKDFIFRSLDMPLMRTKELKFSLAYEIEKYIPFKAEELAWDYGYSRLLKEKKLNISFIGVKLSDLNRIENLLSRLDLKSVLIEPSCLSLARIIKSQKDLSLIKNFAIMDFSQQEAYLTFFKNNLPVFNRYIAIPQKAGNFDLDSFIESVNFSFQYFKREFKSYNLEKFIIVTDSQSEQLVSCLKEELQSEIKVISSYDLTSYDNAKIENLKALGATSIDYSPYKFKPKLRKSRPEVDLTALPQATVALRIGLLSIFTVISLIASGLFYTVLETNLGEQRLKLKNEKTRVEQTVPEKLRRRSWEEREKLTAAKEKEYKTLNEIFGSFKKVSYFFEKLSLKSTMPKGSWFEELRVEDKGKGYTAALTGYIWRNDDYEERLGLDELISNFTGDEQIMSIFENVTLSSSSRKKMGEFEVTGFTLNCTNK